MKVATSLLVFVSVLVCAYTAPLPPLWPEGFSTEYTDMTGDITSFTGTWFYDKALDAEKFLQTVNATGERREFWYLYKQGEHFSITFPSSGPQCTKGTLQGHLRTYTFDLYDFVGQVVIDGVDVDHWTYQESNYYDKTVGNDPVVQEAKVFSTVHSRHMYRFRRGAQTADTFDIAKHWGSICNVGESKVHTS